MKFLVLLGLFVALVWLIRGGRRGSRGGDSSASPRAGETREPSREVMVACEHCGLNLPQGEALCADGRWYCSDAHRDAHSGAARR
jgi:uncharacterized protein